MVFIILQYQKFIAFNIYPKIVNEKHINSILIKKNVDIIDKITKLFFQNYYI